MALALFLALLLAALVQVVRKVRQARRLQTLASTDELTGVANRRALMIWLEEEFARTRSAGDGMAVLMIDVDHFKRVNDTHGHAMGDMVLKQLARTLQEVAASIPPGLDWVLRVDGHTDRQPIRDAVFHSNWELSTARAISVIEFLIDQGIPPQHLAAAGFGEYRPIDPRDDEAAYRRNRRIEFKLTEG